MTNHPRYPHHNSGHQPGSNQLWANRIRANPLRTHISNPTIGDTLNAHHDDPYRDPFVTEPIPAVRKSKARKRSRAGSLSRSTAAVAVVSAGAGALVLATQPDHSAASSLASALATAPNVPAASPPAAHPSASSAPAGSVEQVAAKVLPSVVKLQIDMGGERRGFRHRPGPRWSDPDQQPRGGRAQRRPPPATAVRVGRTRPGGPVAPSGQQAQATVRP